MHVIVLNRIERDCERNRAYRANSTAKTPRGLLYDHHVVIDGEHRATWQAYAYRRGYYLRDLDGRPIYWGLKSSRTDEVSSKDLFIPTIRRCLAEGEIPTLQRMAELREQEAAAKAKILEESRQEAIAHRVRNNGQNLLEALKAILAADEAEDEDALRDAIVGGHLAVGMAEDTGGNFADQVEQIALSKGWRPGT